MMDQTVTLRNSEVCSCYLDTLTFSVYNCWKQRTKKKEDEEYLLMQRFSSLFDLWEKNVFRIINLCFPWKIVFFIEREVGRREKIKIDERIFLRLALLPWHFASQRRARPKDVNSLCCCCCCCCSLVFFFFFRISTKWTARSTASSFLVFIAQGWND